MLNVFEFIRLSDEKRAELLFSFCPVDAAKWNVAVIRERMKQAVKELLPATATDNPDALKLFEQLGKFISPNLQQSMIDGLAWLKKRKSEIEKEKKQNAAASVGAVNLEAKDGKKSFRHVEDIRTDIAKEKENERRLVEDIASAKSTADGIKRLENEKKQLGEQIEKAKAETGAERIGTLKRQIEETKVKIVSIPDSEREAIAGIETNLSELKQEKITIEFDMRTHRSLLSKAEDGVKKFESGNCPTCGQSAVTSVLFIHEEIKSYEQLIASDERALETVQSKIENASLDCAERTRDIREKEKNNSGYQQLVNDLERQLATLVGQSSGVKTLEARLDALNKTKIEGTSLNADEAELQLQGIRNRIGTLETELSEKNQYDTKVRLMKESSLKAKQSEELSVIVKALIEEVQNVRREMVQDALQPVKAEAKELLAVTGINAEFTFQFEDTRGNDVFKFGWLIHHQYGQMFVDFDSLSTAQQIFTLISLLSPLIHRGNPKLRMLLLDNCEVVHEQYRTAFVELLEKAHGRFLDNIIIASSAEYPVQFERYIHHVDQFEVVA
jgi:hypothetical protein